MGHEQRIFEEFSKYTHMEKLVLPHIVEVTNFTNNQHAFQARVYSTITAPDHSASTKLMDSTPDDLILKHLIL